MGGDAIVTNQQTLVETKQQNNLKVCLLKAKMKKKHILKKNKPIYTVYLKVVVYNA